jgi:hypothetical protein
VKPKLVYFQYQYDPALPALLLTHGREHVDCLTASFDVTVVNLEQRLRPHPRHL